MRKINPSPFPLDYSEVFPLVNKKVFSGFRASKAGLKYVEQWMKSGNIEQPMVVITLRQYGYDTSRNSNIEEWSKFAVWLKSQGYTPVFVPDTDACWKSNKSLEDFITITDACWNLGLRLALYERAFVSLFYSSGVAALCSLSSHARYIAFYPVIEESLQAKAETYERYGLVSGQRRYDFAQDHQLLSWKRDSFERHKRGVYGVCKVDEPLND